MPEPIHAAGRPLTAAPADLSNRYLAAIRAGDMAGAAAVLREAATAELRPEAIHEAVIAPAMVSMGELWERNAIGVADEHLATAITLRLLDRVYETSTPGPARDETVVCACVEGEEHTVGLRMAADLLELDGFRVVYLGADVPAAETLRIVRARAADAVCLSATVSTAVPALVEQVATLTESFPALRLLVGGAAVPPTVCAAEGVVLCARVQDVRAAASGPGGTDALLPA